MDAGKFLDRIESERGYRKQIVHEETIPARKASTRQIPNSLSPNVIQAIKRNGISALYLHQAEAVKKAMAGKNLTISTGTASGKTLCYTIPVLEEFTKNPRSTFLFMYPTKALAQDQLRALSAYRESGFDFTAGTYDGDTPSDIRAKLRESGSMILTNPEMMHQGILPNHAKWNSFFANLKYIVVDEIHIYRGVFGSNVANLLRRLNRICRFYGSKPQYICCSATIANPKELAERLTGRPMEVIDKDASPRGKKRFVFWNPPVIDVDGVERSSANGEGVRLMTSLVEDRIQTITFVRTRTSAEIIYKYTQEELQRRGSGLAKNVTAYRGGYLPEERRAIERKLASGELLGVSCTNALELGIDIGSLDACIIVGYPGTIASMWQEAGRAGRKSEEALIVYIANNSPIDQFMIRNAEYFFGRSPENAIIDPENPHVLIGHLRCALHELPITESEAKAFGEYLPALMGLLEEDRQAARDGKGWRWMGKRGFPAQDISLRTMTNAIYTIQTDEEKPKVIGTIDEISAFEQVHTHAVYIHNAETYFVNRLDVDRKIAHVAKQDLDYYTQSVDEANIHVDYQEEEKEWKRNRIAIGDVTVHNLTFMFKKIKFRSRESIGYENLDLPEQVFDTTAFWIVPPPAAFTRIKKYSRSIVEGLAGIANVLVEVIPVYTMCDPSDIGTVVDSTNLGVSTLFVFDRYQGGMGFAERAYEKITEILPAALRLIEECPCRQGCPSCVGSAMPPFALTEIDTGTRGKIPDKEAALLVLHEMLGLKPYVPKYAPPSGEAPEDIELPLPEEERKPVPVKKLPPNVERKIRKRVKQLGRDE